MTGDGKMQNEIESKWVTGAELLIRWGLKPFELLEYIKKALTPFSQDSLRPFDIPGIVSFDTMAAVHHAVKTGMTNLDIAGRPINLNDLGELPSISECLFKRNEIEFFERTYDIGSSTENSAESLNLINNLIEEVKPEIESIYNAMKRDVGFSAYTLDIEIKLKEKAISTFSHKKNEYKLIRIEHLEDSRIYQLDPGQSKRDFVGALLKKIVEEQIGREIGGQKLYKLYTKKGNFSTKYD